MTSRRNMSLVGVAVLAALFLGAVCAVPASANPVSYYDFEDGSGTQISDVFGANHAAIQAQDGVTDWVGGAPGGASPTGGYDFNGAGEYGLTTATASSMGIGGNNAKTISAWVYTRSFNNGGIYDMGTNAPGQDFSLRTLTGTDQWRAQFWSTPDFDFTATGSQNNWSHFVLIHDGTRGYAYYNGNLIGGKMSTANTADVNPFQIARWAPGPNTFDGVIDEVAVYDSALDYDQVQHLYNGGNPVAVPAANGSAPPTFTGYFTHAQQTDGTWNRLELHQADALQLALGGEATYLASRAYAATVGGATTSYLATPRGRFENERIHGVLPSGTAWIGIDDTAVEGEWRLVDNGEQVWQGLAANYAANPGSPVGGAYTNWFGGEPNDHPPESGEHQEDALQFRSDGLWNDHIHNAGEHTGRQFVVEIETAYATKPAVPVLDDPLPSQYDRIDGNGRGYFAVRRVNLADGALLRDMYGIENYLWQQNGVGGGSSADYTDPNTASLYTINYDDPDGVGGGQIAPNPVPHPGDQAGVDDNRFLIKAVGTIIIDEEDDYTIGWRGDDGGQLTIVGQTFTQVGSSTGDATNEAYTGAGPGDTIFRPYNGGNVSAWGVTHLVPGRYELVLQHFENTGGGDVELLGAQGAHMGGFTAGTASPFRAIGYRASDGDYVTVAQPGIDEVELNAFGIPGWAIEFTTPSANGTIDSVATAEAALLAERTLGGGFATHLDTQPSVNYQDPHDGSPGDAGSIGGDIPFPWENPAYVDPVPEVNDEDFAGFASAKLNIPVDGIYRFGFQGDDGGYLRIPGGTFTSIVENATGNAVIDEGGARINCDCLTGNSRTIGEIFLTAGVHDIEALFLERGGGNYWEVFASGPGGLDSYALLTTGAAGVYEDFDGIQLVPEPSTALLALLGLVGLAFARRRK